MVRKGRPSRRKVRRAARGLSRARYNPSVARRLAELAYNARLDADALDAAYPPADAPSGYQLHCFLGDPSGVKGLGIQGFVARKGEEMAVAFRGSEQRQDWRVIRDWMVNLRIFPSHGGFLPPRTEAKIHSGFLLAYAAVRSDMLASVKVINPRHVYVTGYSMGGALATLAALDIRLRFRDQVEVTMYNFGSPRVGNIPFAAYYNRHVRDSHRVVHFRDVVATLPPTFGYYRHVLRRHELPCYPDSKFPYHEDMRRYYIDQISAEGYEGRRDGL